VAAHRALLYSSTHFFSTSPFGNTTNVKYPSLTSRPSLASPSFSLAALQTSLKVIFFPTFNNLFLYVIAYTTRASCLYSPLMSHEGAGASGGNIATKCAENVVDSTKPEMTSDVAYCGYKKNTGIMRVACVGSSTSKCGDKQLSKRTSGFDVGMRFRS
jgi:hypothetical protein